MRCDEREERGDTLLFDHYPRNPHCRVRRHLQLLEVAPGVAVFAELGGTVFAGS